MIILGEKLCCFLTHGILEAVRFQCRPCISIIPCQFLLSGPSFSVDDSYSRNSYRCQDDRVCCSSDADTQRTSIGSWHIRWLRNEATSGSLNRYRTNSAKDLAVRIKDITHWLNGGEKWPYTGVITKQRNTPTSC